MEQECRIVVLIDMDCFYCQVEEKLNPDLKGKPIAVVQYNPWQGGGIIAVNYVARAMGVTRHMRGNEAKEKCPEIQLPSVPCQRGKADITKYRDAGKEVAKVLQKFTTLLERASIDEAYLDITDTVQKRIQKLNINTLTSDTMPNTFALGYASMDQFISEVHSCGSDSIDFDYDHAKLLLVGALIVSEIRAAVYEETGYQCSAGIAHNKILAKLVCGMNKPNKQTVLPKHTVNILYKTLPLKKIKHLGGKFGDAVCETLKIKTMTELQQFSEKELQNRFDEKNGTWLYNIARGIDLEPVQARFNPKSIGCCKQFRGKSALVDLESLKKWLHDLGEEIDDRLEKDALENNRTPKQMVVSFSVQHVDGRDVSSSRSYNFAPEDELSGELFSNKALELLMDAAEGCKIKDGESNRRLKAPIKFLGISVGKFEDNNDSKKTKKIKDYFAASNQRVLIQTGDGNPKHSTKKDNERVCKSDKEGKDYIIRKFLQNPKDIVHIDHTKAESKQYGQSSERVIESTLDKQESFFAKFLSAGVENSKLKVDPQNNPDESKNEVIRPQTPVCNIISGEDCSNDTAYSGSTIDEEINKSIALFEEDPDDIERVSKMRQLLNTSNVVNSENKTEDVNANLEVPIGVSQLVSDSHKIETIECSECGKVIPLDTFDLHADFHLALKIREEEKQQVRKEREKNMAKETNNKDVQKRKKDAEEINNKTGTAPSMFNFLTKLDGNIPSETCSECGKRVPVEKMVEHQDFHEAQRLSREINNKIVISNSTTKNNSFKRKRKSTSPAKKLKVPCKSIDQFFK